MKTMRKTVTAFFAVMFVVCVMNAPDEKKVPNLVEDAWNLTCEDGPELPLARESSLNTIEPDGQILWGIASDAMKFAPFGKVAITSGGKEIPFEFFDQPPPPPPWRDNRGCNIELM